MWNLLEGKTCYGSETWLLHVFAYKDTQYTVIYIDVAQFIWAAGHRVGAKIRKDGHVFQTWWHRQSSFLVAVSEVNAFVMFQNLHEGNERTRIDEVVQKKRRWFTDADLDSHTRCDNFE